MTEQSEISPLLENVSYCINPQCSHRRNSDDAQQCQTCGTDLLLGDRYRLVRPLRELSDAFPTEIFEVEDWDLDAEDAEKPKVVKILNRYYNSLSLKLFQREATVLISLDIAGLPRVAADGYFTVQLERGNKLHCLVMEQIEGENLLDWLKKNGSISEQQAIAWLRELTVLLGYVHERGLLHRDIKPSNIVRRPNGELALIDFGSVGFIDRAVTPVGSYGYTPPEQVNGQALPQSDFFALGCTIVHLLTGEHPYDLPKNKLGQLNWRFRVTGLSREFADLIDEAIAPSAQERPANTQVILERLDAIGSSISGQADNSQTDSPSGQANSPPSIPIEPETPRESPVKPPPKNRIPPWWQWQQVVAISLLFSIGFVGLRLLLPPVSEVFNRVGQKNRRDRFWERAEFLYRWAIRLDEDNAKAYYNLGSLYERSPVRELQQSREAYKRAIAKRFPPAHNNLGRLEIIAKNYTEAVRLLLEGLVLAEEDGVKYSLNKNLGWARLEQGRLEQAEARLKRAIALDSHKGAAYCLLAQVLETKGDRPGALKHWENCIAYGSYRQSPEEDNWIDTGQKRLAQQKQGFQDFRTRQMKGISPLTENPTFFWRQVCQEDTVPPKSKVGSKLLEAKHTGEMEEIREDNGDKEEVALETEELSVQGEDVGLRSNWQQPLKDRGLWLFYPPL